MGLEKKIEKDLHIDSEYILNISKRNNLYKRFFISKKDGGKREIFHPSKELKVIQRWMVENVWQFFPVSECSFAYKKGKSIKDNANEHLKSRYILHMDLKKFFPSINDQMLDDFWNKKHKTIENLKDFSKEDYILIKNICLFEGKMLVIGSPSSPSIANAIMFDFDKELCEIINNYSGMKYSRYADDIIISSKTYIKNEIVNDIKECIEKYGFKVNDEKTRFMNRSSRRKVTGIILDNNKNELSVGNSKIKTIERKIYNYLIKGEGEKSYIIGYLSYIKSINQNQYNNIERIYRRFDKNNELFK